MTDHGFGLGKLYSEKTTPRAKQDIAKCISEVEGVLWAHVVHKGFHYDSREETPKSRDDMQVKDRYDILIEMTHGCKQACMEAIAKCALDQNHQITIDKVTIREDSYHKGRIGKHPKPPKDLKLKPDPQAPLRKYEEIY